MQHALCGSLINGAYGVDIGGGDSGLVASLKGLVKALDSGLDPGGNYTVVKVFLSGDCHTL